MPQRRLVSAAVLTALATAAVVVIVVTNVRWQFYGLLIAAAVGMLLAVLRPRRLFFALGIVAALGSLAGGVLSLWAFQPLDLPDPGGQHPVGTTVAYWRDSSRPEPATADPADKRDVTAQIWYPSTSSGPESPYLGARAELVAEGLGTSLGVPPFLLSEAVRGHGHAGTDSPVATGSFPIVLFSPGLLGIRTQNTAWAEFLAARGYVVVALDHPYDSATTITQDGRAVRSTVRSTGRDGEDDATANRLTSIRAADLSFALDQLIAMPLFQGRLDLQRTAVAGHSAGGAAALQAAARDGRFRAAIDLDGFPRNEARPKQPVLALVAGEGTGNLQSDEEYDAALTEVLEASSDGRRITVPGTKHLSFTDAPFLLPPLPMLFGSASPEEAYAATTEATLAFLEQTLRTPGAGVSSPGSGS